MYDKLEKRIEKIEDKQISILQEISTFKPILETLNENVKKIGENTVDRFRVEAIEKKLVELEDATIKRDADKWNKSTWLIISGIITAILGYIIGKF